MYDRHHQTRGTFGLHGGADASPASPCSRKERYRLERDRAEGGEVHPPSRHPGRSARSELVHGIGRGRDEAGRDAATPTGQHHRCVSGPRRHGHLALCGAGLHEHQRFRCAASGGLGRNTARQVGNHSGDGACRQYRDVRGRGQTRVYSGGSRLGEEA